MGISEEKIRIAFFINDLDMGGIQRSTVALLENIDPNKYTVDLFLSGHGGILRARVPSYITVRPLPSLPAFTKFIPFLVTKKLFTKKYQLQQSYDVAIDYNGYQPSTALAALSTKAIRRVIWVHQSYSERIKRDLRFKTLFKATRSKFRLFDHIVLVSEGIADDGTLDSLVAPGVSTHVVNNYIDVDDMRLKSEEAVDITIDDRKYNLVSVCRLVRQKNVADAIREFSVVYKRNKNIHFYVVGDGPERRRLEQLAASLGVDDALTFLGQRSNPYSIMRLMDGFISTAFYEGQGMSTLEAKYFGLDIFIPKILEKYSYNVQGSDDLSRALAEASRDIDVRRADKGVDTLESYNTNVLRSFDEVISPHG